MLKHIVLASAMMFCLLPTASHAMSKKPKKSQQVGGAERPVAAPQPTARPESPECKASKEYANGLRTDALKSLNSAATRESSGAAQLDINFFNCRQNYAQEAVSVAEISVCGGYLSQGQMKDKVAANLKECDAKRAAEKLALSKGLAPVKDNMPIILTTPEYQAPRAPAPAPVSNSSAGKAAGANSVR